MKSALNVMLMGTGALICASLLSACDGRGVTPFKSYQYTPEEMLQNKLALQGGDLAKHGEQPAGDLGAGTGGTPADAANGGGDSGKAIPAPAVQPVSPAAPATSSPAATPPADAGSADAQGHVFYEFKKLSDELNSAMAKVDPRVAQIIKGIDIPVVPSDSGLVISIDARLLLNGHQLDLFVDKTPVGYANTADQVEALKIRLAEIDGSGDADPAKYSIVGQAFCSEAQCYHVNVLLDIGIPGDRVIAAFTETINKKTSQFEISASNMTDDMSKIPSAKAIREAKSGSGSASGSAPASGDNAQANVMTPVPNASAARPAPQGPNAAAQKAYEIFKAKQPSTATAAARGANAARKEGSAPVVSSPKKPTTPNAAAQAASDKLNAKKSSAPNAAAAAASLKLNGPAPVQDSPEARELLQSN